MSCPISTLHTLRTRPDLGPLLVLALLVLGWAALFAWLSLARHAAYQSHAFDLGNMDQALWNTAHGRVLRFTDMDVGGRVLTSRLAIHVEPILVPIAALYWLHSGPGVVLVLQAVIVSAGTVPIYALARAAIGMPWFALVFPLAYLAHPSLQNAVLDDFHAVTLSAAFLAWALWALWADRLLPFTAAAILAASTKEEVGLLIAVLGIWLALRGRPRAAAIAMVGGVSWFLICVLAVIPHFNPSGESPYLSRYGYLGHGVFGIVSGVLLHPATVAHTLTSQGRIDYLAYLTHPLGLVSLLGAPILLLTLPALAINLLSADPTMYSGFYQYSAEIVPYTVVAAIFAVRWVLNLQRRLGIRGPAMALCALVLIGAIVDCRRWGFTPLSDGYVIPSGGSHAVIEDRLLRQIPDGAVVSAADEVEPHLSSRLWAYLFPTIHPRNGPQADTIFLDASIPASPVGPGVLQVFASRALQSGYGIAAANDGILVLRRGANRHHLPTRFYRFAFSRPLHATRSAFRWGPFTLVAFVIHPQSGMLNRSRPAIGVETYWRLSRPVKHDFRPTLVMSRTYGDRPHDLGLGWQAMTSDSPTLAWLPTSRWPAGRIVHVAYIGLLPSPGDFGAVDLGIGVPGRWPLRTGPGERTLGGPRIAYLSTLHVVP